MEKRMLRVWRDYEFIFGVECSLGDIPKIVERIRGGNKELRFSVSLISEDGEIKEEIFIDIDSKYGI
ncbi:MAG: hypothetical protein ACRC7N_21045 [Clostridium sp.]